MKVRLFWPIVHGFYLALPPFQYRRLDRMGFGEFLSIEPFWIDLALVQELWGRWDSRSGAFLFPWGHMTPTLKDVIRLIGLRVHGAVCRVTPTQTTAIWWRAISASLPMVREL